MGLAFLLVAIPNHALSSQAGRDNEFNSFWLRFKTAVIKNDKEAVASMTRFPFLWDSEERTRAYFMKIQDKLFTRRIRKCFATAKPLKEGNVYDVFCGDLIFYFGQSDGQYKFLEFGVND